MPRSGSDFPYRSTSRRGCSTRRLVSSSRIRPRLSGVYAAGSANVTSEFDFEPVRREALDAHRCPRSGWTRLEVLPDTGHDVPPPGELAPVEDVRLRLADAAIFTVAFGAKPNAVGLFQPTLSYRR